jgi:16S rRNA processing protein RimM
VGRVGRPHGLDGAFVVERASDDERRFSVGARLLVDGEPAEVALRRRVGGGRIAIKLDRPVVRGQMLTVARAELPPPEADSYYVFQLIGLEVEEDGRVVGRVRDVLPGAANDNLELDTGVLVPLVEVAIAKVDLDRGRILLNPGFTD